MDYPEVTGNSWKLSWLAVAIGILVLDGLPGLADEPFKLGVQEKGYIQQSPVQGYADYPAYPTPHMIPQQPIPGKVKSSPPLRGGTQESSRPPMNMGVQQVQLPPQFLGLWIVEGRRTKVEALPEYQEGAEGAFHITNSQTWEITGSPEAGYTMGSSAGAKTPLIVDKVQGSTAFIRYQGHQKNTIVQEAIVMTLADGGARFQGLERVSIVKPGEPTRARVTYQLNGSRQR